MQEELTGVLAELLTNKISELLRLTLGKQEIDTLTELRSVFELSEVKTRVLAFFESLKVGDLFQELFEMERNRKILDKQELYFYFCDILVRQREVSHLLHSFQSDCSRECARHGIRLAALHQQACARIRCAGGQSSKRTGVGLPGVARNEFFTLLSTKRTFLVFSSAALQELINVLQLDGTVDIGNSAHQVAKSQLIRLSNACYFAFSIKQTRLWSTTTKKYFDSCALGKDNPLAVAFQKLIDDFIHRDPKSFTLEVEDEWDDSSPSDRLVFNSPIPLNSEQRQIVSALNKDGCRYITVEGPPGTGKSHTITAVVFDAIHKDQSVLVLSDKKEALDVVEDKITEHDEQGPVRQALSESHTSPWANWQHIQ